MRAHRPRALFLLSLLLSLSLAACFGGHGHGGGGGGGGGGTPTPKLRVDFTGGPFTPFQQGASYQLFVRNKGDAATSGMVTLIDPPTGMTVTSITGPNWTCDLPTTTCSRSDSLGPGATYDTITVIGNVTMGAGGSVSATVTVSGGGAATFSGSGSIPVNGPTGAAVSIIQPGVVFPQLVAGSKLTLQAAVGQGDNGSGVNWGVQAGDTCSANGFMSILGTQGGSAPLGTVPGNAANGAVVTYTAPSPAPAAPNNVFTITALQAPAVAGPCIVVTVVATTNGLFSGNFVFRFRGFVPLGQTFAIISRFHADGVGKADLSSGISAGLEDVNIAQAGGSSMAFQRVAFTGGYNMDSPSHGTMKLTITTPPAQWATANPPPPTTMNFSFTLSADGSFGGLIETDGMALPQGYAGSGDFQFQRSSKNFNVTRFFPSYVLSLDGPVGLDTAHKGLIGRLDLVPTVNSTTAGTIAATSSSDDQSGTANAALSGTYSLDAAGSDHGVFSITGGANPHVSFYIIRPGVFYALRIDQNAVSTDGILLGALHSVGVDANGVPLNFDNTSLNGPFVFNLLGIKAGLSSAAAGHFSGTPGASGSGNLAGFMDINDGGTVSTASFTGATPPNTATFTIATNGRGKIAIAAGGVTYNFVFYARGPNQGFLLEQPPTGDPINRGRSGGWLVQSILPPIEAAGANGTYILATTVVTPLSFNTLAVLSLNGGNANSGTFTGTSYSSFFNSPATTSQISGTFTVTDTTNGRGTLTVTAPGFIGSFTHLAFEVYDSADAVLVGTDNGNQQPQIIVLDE